MKLTISAPIGVLFALALCGSAIAQPIQYQSADGINNTPVSQNSPLPISGTVSVSGSGDASAANQVISNNALGTPGDTVCATDTGSCSLEALSKRIAQWLSTINSATGLVNIVGNTTQGATAYGLQSAASTNSTLISTGAHTLKGLHLSSTSTTVMYARMYDSSSAPTCSSATGFVRTFPIPPAASAGLVGGYEVKLPPEGVKYSTGLSFCITGGPTSTDNTNATTGGFLNAEYN